MRSFKAPSLTAQVLAILGAKAGPVEVDFLVWRLRDKGYFACRVKGAVRSLVRRGLVITSGQGEVEILGSTLVEVAPRRAPSAAAWPAAHRQTNRLQRLLCSPLVGGRSGAA